MRTKFAVIVGTALVAVLVFSGVAVAATLFALTKTAPKGGDRAHGQRQGLL